VKGREKYQHGWPDIVVSHGFCCSCCYCRWHKSIFCTANFTIDRQEQAEL